jgi:nucleotide-binding universal stress UspA family protein
MGTIIVGVDGSPNSNSALDWAIEEAGLRAATLKIVLAWHEPYIADFRYAVVSEIDMLEHAASEVLDESVAKATAALTTPVERVLRYGPAAQALLAEADGADLLVVGSRGHGGFTGLLLGSVVGYVAHHAVCPLVIVRAAK